MTSDKLRDRDNVIRKYVYNLVPNLLINIDNSNQAVRMLKFTDLLDVDTIILSPKKLVDPMHIPTFVKSQTQNNRKRKIQNDDIVRVKKQI